MLPSASTLLAMALVILGSAGGSLAAPVASPACRSMFIISSDWTMARRTVFT